jgi:hypothetical protein
VKVIDRQHENKRRCDGTGKNKISGTTAVIRPSRGFLG